jgi:hypothetical protein
MITILELIILKILQAVLMITWILEPMENYIALHSALWIPRLIPYQDSKILIGSSSYDIKTLTSNSFILYGKDISGSDFLQETITMTK